MDFSLSFSSDWWNLLSIPMILFTIKDVRAGWHSIWHERLTPQSRMLLKRMVIFLLMPFVVLVHELGHLCAALQVGAHVVDFHYGPLTGHVTVINDTPEQHLWIAFAGNFVQIIVGMAVLLTSPLRKSPAAVALSVYFGLLVVSGTTVFYALLSLGGFYGDWMQMYQNPLHGWVAAIVVFQAAINAFLYWCVTATWPRMWFARRTNPDWYAMHANIERQCRESPSMDNFIALSESFATGGLLGEAGKALDSANKLAPEHPKVRFMRGRIASIDGKLEKAIASFTTLQDDESLNPIWRSRLCLEIGQLRLANRDPNGALTAFTRAEALDPQLGDARLFKGSVLNSLGRYGEAMGTFMSMPEDADWENPQGRELLVGEIEKAQKGQAQGHDK